ncbi:MAG: DNA polymerase III subunit delta' [Proteobacteria bacterium]|nr:DNA polymerase III subunit delta' [Pseudomonadota bacterium]
MSFGAPQPPWLGPATAQLAQALAAQHLPHALLIHEAPGTGGEWLAAWTAALVLCQQRERAPCGACAACRRVQAGEHPDLLWLRPIEDSRQLRIEQVRELGAELALTSHAGGFKVGILSPADALNMHAANALLKTLEEPRPRTLLVLVATQPSRLPATVRSRCQRLRIGVPPRAQALQWLTDAHGPGEWAAALQVLGDAPFLALQHETAALARTAQETRRTLDSLAAGTADPVSVAEQWARAELPLRLLGFERWLTERIAGRAGGEDFLAEMRPDRYLSESRSSLNIGALFGLLDEVREMRGTLDAPLNRGLALEGIFRRLNPA